MSWLRYDGTLFWGLSHDGRLVELHRIGSEYRIIIHERCADGGWAEYHCDLSHGRTTLRLIRDLLGARSSRRAHPAGDE